MPEQVRTDAGAAQQHRLAIDHERRVPIVQRSLDDQWVSPAPVVATAGEQTNAFALALKQSAGSRRVLSLCESIPLGWGLSPPWSECTAGTLN